MVISILVRTIALEIFMSQKDGFPKYLMEMDLVRQFLSMEEARHLYHCDPYRVKVGDKVLEYDFKVRAMSRAERQDITSK